MFILLFQVAVFAQGHMVKGTVKDAKSNETLPGVSVVVEGTTTGTTTDAKGDFSINVDGAGKKLIISSVGFMTQNVSADQENVSVSLAVNSVLLKETVITALGVSKEKKALGYSVSEVSGDVIEKSGETNVIEALAAKAPGVMVTGSGGTPGASSKIILRGNSRFGENQPLIVIDGVPVDNSTNAVQAGDAPFNVNLAGVNESNRALDINPDDIESVSVLKGPAAAALYGSRAGNGAIIYTTKRGQYGKGLGATYSTSMEFDKVNKLPELQTKYGQGKLKGGIPTTSLTTPNSWGPEAVDPRNPYNDFFKTGNTLNNNLAIYGGNESTSLRLSIGNTHQTGIVPNTGMDRTTVRLTSDSKLSKVLTAGGTVDYTNTSATRAQNGSNLSGVMLSLCRTPSSFDIRDYKNADGTQKQYYPVYDNPLYTAKNNPYTDQTNRIMGNAYIKYKPCSFFDASYKIGTDAYTTNAQQIYSISSMGDDNASGLGQVNRSSLSNRNIYSDLLLNFNKRFANDQFGLEGMLGHNFTYSENELLFARGRNLQIPNYYNLNNASELYSSNSGGYQRTQAAFAEAAFDFKRMVYLTMTGRNEWSTAFGKGSKGFFYPKADLSWVFSELMNPNSFFSFGKVRAAYAIGGLAPHPYSNKTYYGVPLYTDGFTVGNTLPYLGQSGYTISTMLGNPSLRPETVTGIEAGLDLRFFNSHLTTELTLYQQTSKDLLVVQPIAASSGFTSRYVNAGEMVNKGIEVSLGLDPIQLINKSADKFVWNITAGFSLNRNKVTKLLDGVDKFEVETGFGDPGAYAMVGQPLGVLMGSAWKRNGNGELLTDADGLPQFDANTKIIANPNPDWLMNINNTFHYKNFNVGFLWDIRHGGQIWNGTRASLYSRGKLAATEDRTSMHNITGVFDDGTPNAGKASSINLPGYDGSGADYYTYMKGQNGPTENSIEDGSWVRLRSVNASYRFNLNCKDKKCGFKYIELGLTGRNLLLFTKYTGVDPETSLTGAGSNINGFDYFNNPGTKSYLINLKAGF